LELSKFPTPNLIPEIIDQLDYNLWL